MEQTKDIQHPLKYYLVESGLTADGKKIFIGKLVTGEVLGIENIAREMVAMGSTVTLTDAAAVMEMQWVVILKELARGNIVHFGPLRIHPSLKGSFKDLADFFEEGRNFLNIKTSLQDYFIRKFTGQVHLEKTEHSWPVPIPESFLDDTVREVNSRVTSLETASISGKRLKYNPDDPEQGVFFIKDDNAEIRVPTATHNNPTKLAFKVPQLESGIQYRIEVRIKNASGKLLKGQLLYLIEAV